MMKIFLIFFLISGCGSPPTAKECEQDYLDCFLKNYEENPPKTDDDREDRKEYNDGLMECVHQAEECYASVPDVLVLQREIQHKYQL